MPIRRSLVAGKLGLAKGVADGRCSLRRCGCGHTLIISRWYLAQRWLGLGQPNGAKACAAERGIGGGRGVAAVVGQRAMLNPTVESKGVGVAAAAAAAGASRGRGLATSDRVCLGCSGQDRRAKCRRHWSRWSRRNAHPPASDRGWARCPCPQETAVGRRRAQGDGGRRAGAGHSALAAQRIQWMNSLSFIHAGQSREPHLILFCIL